MRVKWRIGIALSVVGIGVTVALGWNRTGKVPAGEMEEVRKLLLQADSLNASFHCPAEYRKVRKQYEETMKNWGKENEKWFFSRKYEEVRNSAVRIRSDLEIIIRKSASLGRSTNDDIRKKINQLRLEMKEFEAIFSAMPLDVEVKEQYAEGKLLLNAAELAFEKGEHETGILKGQQAACLIRKTYDRAYEKLKEYFGNSSVWQQEMQKAIVNSRQNRGYAIIIEKFPPRCYLYEKGVKKYIFRAEFGKNWMGDKSYEGDDRTPEGQYQVKKKMKGNSTRYYKAFLLDYPNAVDRQEFERRKKEGRLPAGARIGGNIEIHGNGGRYANWTQGCIALKNEDMDLLYGKVAVGTPVIVIGSSQTLEEALKNYNLGWNHN